MAPPSGPPAQPDPPELDDLRRQLLAAAALGDPTERLLEVAAIVGEALSDLGIQPVVVGGLALAYWASGDEFVTGDIDVLVPRVPEVVERLEELGFAPQGREWRLPGYDVSFEAPGEVLEPGDEAEWATRSSTATGSSTAPWRKDSHTLQALRALTAEIEGGRVVEEWEIVELGREAERQSYSPDGDD